MLRTNTQVPVVEGAVGLKMLYVGPLDEAGTCFSRLQALREVCPKIETLDTNDLFRGLGRFQRLVEVFAFYGPAYRRLNRMLLQCSAQTGSNVVWIDKGFWVWPRTVRRLAAQGVFCLQHNTDSLWPRRPRYRWTYWLSRRSLRHYALYLTSNEADRARIKEQIAGPDCELTLLGYDHRRFGPGPIPDGERAKWASKLLFVGHHEPRTERYITAAVQAELPVSVFGSGWHHAARKPVLAQSVRAQTLSADDYVYALKSAEVGLGLVSQWNGNQTAGRSYEIPACGTFLLGLRTPEHQRLYREGEDAEFFASPEEFVAKARVYLADRDMRERVATSGQRRCLASRRSWREITLRDWQTVMDVREARTIRARRTRP